MKDFICKKCGNTTYIIQEKSNGTGVATGLYCAKCGTWHKWLNKQEKILYTTHSEEIDKDKEIARLTAENAELTRKARKLETENARLKEEAEEQKSIAEHEHATQMDWFNTACEYKAENAALHARLSNAVILPCKCEDTLYCVHWSKYNPKGGIITEEFVHKITLKDRNNTYTIHTICNGIWTESKFVAIDFGDILFTDRAKAEARLAELKGGGQ